MFFFWLIMIILHIIMIFLVINTDTTVIAGKDGTYYVSHSKK